VLTIHASVSTPSLKRPTAFRKLTSMPADF
jgi:hypothetical protein